MPTREYLLRDENQTIWWGGKLASLAKPGMKIYLQGELGSGKTTMVRGFIHALGHRGSVTSPTYTMVDEYRVGGYMVYHVDLYRTGADSFACEWPLLEEYFRTDAICLLEWPERAGDLLPQADVNLQLEYTDDCGRSLKIRACDDMAVAAIGSDFMDIAGGPAESGELY